MGRPGAQIFSALYFDLLKSGKIANEISDGLNRGAPVSPEEAVELDALDQAEVESAVLRYVRIVIEDTPV
jgi:hypothetical protein